MADGALCLPSCPLRLPLLFPKSSSILFGSPVCARQVPQGEAMYSRSVFGTAYRSIQDPSTDARDDKDGFCFQRSFDSRGLCPRLLRMTEERACSVGMAGRTFFDASIIYHLPFYILHLKEALGLCLFPTSKKHNGETHASQIFDFGGG